MSRTLDCLAKLKRRIDLGVVPLSLSYFRMAAFNNTIQWYENKALDDPKLRSPTPCPRGVYCQYKLPNPETKELELACCRMVHPGEEGNGRRLFPARTAPDGREQPACVRLTGKAGFYERCGLKQPWRAWATEHGIPLPPADVPWVQVERGPIVRTPQEEINEHSRRVMRMGRRMRSVPAGGAAYEDSPFTEQQQHARIDAVLARQEVARAMVAVSRAAREAREADAAKPVSATSCSAADWPALPQPPPRIILSGGGGPSYGFTLPPLIQRTRAERLYDESQTD